MVAVDDLAGQLRAALPDRALSQVTRHIGLVATVNTNTNSPYNLARQLSSLDHLSNGRVGWNIVSSLQDSAIKSFGIKNRWTTRAATSARPSSSTWLAHSWDSWDGDVLRLSQQGIRASTTIRAARTSSVTTASTSTRTHSWTWLGRCKVIRCSFRPHPDQGVSLPRNTRS